MKAIYRLLKIGIVAVGYLSSSSIAAFAQVTPDNTVNTTVNQNGNVAEITGGRTEGNNLFHSFQDFSVPTGNEAFFNNVEAIENIFSRVTGGNISNIDGAIRANGSASLFLVNPAGIIFGENARLDVGGSFLGSTADSILFPDDIQFSASDSAVQPILTVNAPIGLGFRDNPGDIVNRANSFDDGGTPDDLFDDSAIGLRVGDDRTIGLIGGNVFFDGGFVTAKGGRIEVGSVAENSTVSFTEIESGWNIGYEQVTNFQDINIAALGQIGSFSENGEITGDVQVRGRNITLTQGGQLGVYSEVGEAGNVLVQASESITIDGNGIEISERVVPSSIFNIISDEASRENSQIKIETPQLNLTNSGAINAFNTDSMGQGVNIFITAAEISLDGAINFDTDFPFPTGIFAQTFEAGVGDGGTINIETNKLTINNGAQINTETFGVGNAGDLVINADESVELIGTNINGDPSSLQVSVEQTTTATGNSGNITVNTPRLTVKDGAQISSVTRSQANGGNININAFESILLSGTAPTTESNIGRTGIVVSAAPSFNPESGELIATTGNAGSINITTKDLNIDRGAVIGANTFSLGDGGNAVINVDNLTIINGGQIRAGSFIAGETTDDRLGQGGNLNITAIDSVSIIGTGDINGEPVNSGIVTLAEGTGDAGSITLTTDELAIADGGEIDASADGNEAAGDITIDANTVDLDRGKIRAITTAGEGGNITLSIDENLTLGNESLISAKATKDANGGNVNIDANLVLAFPSQPNGSDIIASAEQGTGGEINITAESLFGINRGEAVAGNGSNDIDASSQFGLDGSVTISVLDVEPIQEITELPKSLTEGEQTATQACQNSSYNRPNTLTVNGKGGIERQPVELLDSDLITIGQYKETEPQSHKVQSFQTSQGKVTPAQGVAITKDGQIILTSYPTDKEALRKSDRFNNCV